MAQDNDQHTFDFEDDLEVSKNSLTILITGILVIVAGFVTYNFFANQAAQPAGDDLANDVIAQLEQDGENQTDAEEASEQVAADQVTDETSQEEATEENNEESEGGIAGSSTDRDRSLFDFFLGNDDEEDLADATSEEEEELVEGTGGPEEGVEVIEEYTAGTWAANDIAPNSLTETSTYTVQEGDTLWEIAEGVYGSGFEWVKIVDANADDIGYLSNGSQALISAGQVLNIPN